MTDVETASASLRPSCEAPPLAGSPRRPLEIPRHIYQTWHTKDLPLKMRACVDSLRADNPELEHHLFDDADCRAFIHNNFGPEVLHAYNALIPLAYKADLWRYCVLYKLGGVYLDIKFRCIDGFKIVSMLGEERFTKDLHDSRYNVRVYNAFMICLPKNEIMRRCIVQIVDNVRDQYYGESCLHPTGPAMMPQFFSPEQSLLLNDLYLHVDATTSPFIRYKNVDILTNYPEYRADQARLQPIAHYSELWTKKTIYGPALEARATA